MAIVLDSKRYGPRAVRLLCNQIANPVYVTDAVNDPLISCRIAINDSPYKSGLVTANNLEIFAICL